MTEQTFDRPMIGGKALPSSSEERWHRINELLTSIKYERIEF